MLQSWIEKDAHVARQSRIPDDELVLKSICLTRKLAELVRNRPLEFGIREFHHGKEFWIEFWCFL